MATEGNTLTCLKSLSILTINHNMATEGNTHVLSLLPYHQSQGNRRQHTHMSQVSCTSLPSVTTWQQKATHSHVSSLLYILTINHTMATEGNTLTCLKSLSILTINHNMATEGNTLTCLKSPVHPYHQSQHGNRRQHTHMSLVSCTSLPSISNRRQHTCLKSPVHPYHQSQHGNRRQHTHMSQVSFPPSRVLLLVTPFAVGVTERPKAAALVFPPVSVVHTPCIFPHIGTLTCKMDAQRE